MLLLCIAICLLIFCPTRKKNIAGMIRRRRESKQTAEILKLAEGFKGSECTVHLLSSGGETRLTGRITEISDTALLLEGSGTELINAEYILRIDGSSLGKAMKKKASVK